MRLGFCRAPGDSARNRLSLLILLNIALRTRERAPKMWRSAGKPSPSTRRVTSAVLQILQTAARNTSAFPFRSHPVSPQRISAFPFRSGALSVTQRMGSVQSTTKTTIVTNISSHQHP